jgi:hypothetical protein
MVFLKNQWQFDRGWRLQGILILAAAVTATNENVIQLGGSVETLGSTVKDLL